MGLRRPKSGTEWSHLRPEQHPVDSVLFHEAPKYAPVFVGFTGRIGDVATVLVQKVFDIAALEGRKRSSAGGTEVSQWHFGLSYRATELHVRRANLWTVTGHNRALNDVGELADVPGPVVECQRSER